MSDDEMGFIYWWMKEIKEAEEEEEEEETVCVLCGHSYLKSKRRCPMCGEDTFNPNIDDDFFDYCPGEDSFGE